MSSIQLKTIKHKKKQENVTYHQGKKVISRNQNQDCPDGTLAGKDSKEVVTDCVF